MAVSLKRTFKIGDRYYVFKYKPELSTAEVDKQNPILEGDELTAFPQEELPAEKIFTWIYGNVDGDEKLYAREAKNTLELFSKHASILEEVTRNSDKFHTEPTFTLKYAGEMKMSIDPEGTPRVLFNLSSGTYMTDYSLGESQGIGEELTVIFSRLLDCEVHFVPNIETMIEKLPDLMEIFHTNTVDIFEFETVQEASKFMNVENDISKTISQIELLKRTAKFYTPDTMYKFDKEMSLLVTKKTQLEEMLQKTPWRPSGGKSRKRKRNKSKKKNIVKKHESSRRIKRTYLF